jgi:hypothetical protein
MLLSVPDGSISGIHGLLSWKIIAKILVSYSEESATNRDLVEAMTCPDEEQLTIQMIEGIKITPNHETQLAPYHIYATKKFKTTVNKQTKHIPRYDSVQILFDDEQVPPPRVRVRVNSPTNLPLPVIRKPICQVLGIICITDNKLQNNEDPNEPTFLLIVTEFIVDEKKGADKFLPYDLLRYCIDPDGGPYLGDLSIVDAKSVFTPAIVVPCPDRSKRLHSKFSRTSKIGTECIRLWGIKYETLDRNGYDCPSPALPPSQMNALQANIKRARAGARVGYNDENEEGGAHSSDSEDDDDSN